MGAAKDGRIENLRKDLQAIHEPGPRAAEVRDAVNDVNLLAPHGEQVPPTGTSLEDGEVTERAFHRVAAAGQNEDLGSRLEDAFPGDANGVLALATQQLVASGDFDELRIPVA